MDYDKLTREEIVNMCQTLWQKNADLEKNIELYSEQLKKNQQKMYGKSSEKSSLVLQNEMDLFDEADTLANEDEQEESVNIAEHIDEKLELVMIPAQQKLIIHRIPLYACRSCQKKDKGTVSKDAGPVTLFPKSPVSASLVSFLMDMKYSKGVPIYRIEQSMKQEGILFPRHTYARWMIDSSDRYLEKVYTCMHRRLLEEDIVYADGCIYRWQKRQSAETDLYLDVPNKSDSRKKYRTLCPQGRKKRKDRDGIPER
ncbi:transposase [[Clostridium] innocuum]|nr:transposase [[Clostridium] innocuum]